MSEIKEGLRVDEVLGYSYRIIARGTPLDIGMSYQAFDMKQGKVVTLLLLSSAFATGNENLAGLNRSRLAVISLAKEALIHFEHVGLSEGRLYLVRGHAEGHSLTSLLARFRSLQPASAAAIAFHIADALAPVHEAGLVHGSLSSHSVIVAGDGRVAVADTGLFPALRPASLADNEVWGRFPYLAPEQAEGQNPEPGSDVFGIGLLLHEMLTGKLPWEASDKSSLVAHLTSGGPPPPLALPSEVPAALVQTVQQALAPELHVRFRNAGQLANVLSLQVAPTPAAGGVGAQGSDRAHSWRLVVPAPPDAEEEASGGQSPRRPKAKAYWIVIALIIAALLAMLALIPLWLSVRPRNASPTPTPDPLSCPYHFDSTPSVPVLRATGGEHRPARTPDSEFLRRLHRPRSYTVISEPQLNMSLLAGEATDPSGLSPGKRPPGLSRGKGSWAVPPQPLKAARLSPGDPASRRSALSPISAPTLPPVLHDWSIRAS